MIKRLLLTTGIITVTVAAAGSTDFKSMAARQLGSPSITEAWSNRAAAVFNRQGGGFAIVSDSGLIGYSDTGRFDASEAPEALLAILENLPERPDRRPAGKYTPAAPLLGDIAWDQTDPYNLLTPCYYGKQHSATGCVATAMAQIMRYHEYPERGRGSHTYSQESATSTIGELTVDFSQSVYDWEHMTPTYGEWSTETERQAVARLMYDCGVAVSMQYGIMSGADSPNWPAALIKYFSYDEGVGLYYRANFDISEWNRIIRDEITSGRPVFVTGFADAGGHAFVFDGFDADGLVHVNWGWSGMSNGYFDTTYLTPSTQGTGGSDGGFNSRQMIITGIQPPVAGSEPTITLVSEESLTCSRKSVAAADKVTLKLNGKIKNVGWQDNVDADLAVMLADTDGNSIATFNGPTAVSLSKSQDYRNATFENVTFDGIADGSYRLYPVARAAGAKTWQRVRDVDLTFPNYLCVTISDGKVAFKEPDMAALTATAPVADGKIYSGAKALVRATVTNDGGTEYSGNLAAALFDGAGKRVETAETYLKDIMPGESMDIELTATFMSAAGDYRLAIVDNNGRAVSEFTNVDVLAAREMSVIALSGPDFGNENVVEPLDVKATARLSTEAGKLFSGQVFIYIYELDETTVAGSIGPVFVQVDNADSPATVNFSGRFENGRPGKEYFACLVNGENFTYIQPRATATTRFRVAGEASAEITVADGSDEVELYDLMGRRLSAEPECGVYIRVAGGNAEKIVK